MQKKNFMPCGFFGTGGAELQLLFFNTFFLNNSEFYICFPENGQD